MPRDRAVSGKTNGGEGKEEKRPGNMERQKGKYGQATNKVYRIDSHPAPGPSRERLEGKKGTTLKKGHNG